MFWQLARILCLSTGTGVCLFYRISIFIVLEKWQGFHYYCMQASSTSAPAQYSVHFLGLVFAILYNLQALFKISCFHSSLIQFLLTIFLKFNVWYLKFFNVRFHLPCVKPIIQWSLIYLKSFWCVQFSLTTCSKFWIIRKFNKLLPGFSAKKFIYY